MKRRLVHYVMNGYSDRKQYPLLLYPNMHVNRYAILEQYKEIKPLK